MLIIGHRGAPSLKHENTIDSFQAAFDYNLDGIELDVQLSKDHQLVVFHDFDTFLFNNKHDLIKNISFNELQKQTPGIQISRLADILPIVPLHKELHIEIKSNDINNTVIVKKVLTLIRQHKLINQTTISSFNPFVLSQIKKSNQNIKIGLLWTKSPNSPWFVSSYSYYKIKPYSFHASIQYINKKKADWAKANNMKLYCYTVNNTEELSKAQALQVDGIFTDFPNILTR